MKKTFSLLLLPLILIVACMSSQIQFANPDVEIVGHRGHVSTYPENSIQGFLSAIELGIDALELDLVISADRQVVVSHEPYMKSTYMLSPNGNPIAREREKDLKLYEMPYDSIKKFDGGSRKNWKFWRQENLPTYKPLLEEVFDTVEALIRTKELDPVKYYLEIKSEPADYGIFQPGPKEFVDLVMQVVQSRKIQDKVIIMSFDAAILNIIKELYPHMEVSYLWYKSGIEESLAQLDFTPEVVSPYYKQLKNRDVVSSLQQKGIRVVPWTVNSRRQIKKLIHLGVDGIISDYPERVLKEKNKIRN